MSAALSTLRRAQAAGIVIEAEGEELHWRASSPPPESLIAEIRENKPALLRLLSPVPLPGDDAASWQEWVAATALKWNRRGHPWADCLRFAWGEACNLWHSRHGAKPSRDQCAGCGKPVRGTTVIVLPDAARVHGQPCLIDYGKAWRAAATAGLAKLGIVNPSNDGGPE